MPAVAWQLNAFGKDPRPNEDFQLSLSLCHFAKAWMKDIDVIRETQDFRLLPHDKVTLMDPQSFLDTEASWRRNSRVPDVLMEDTDRMLFVQDSFYSEPGQAQLLQTLPHADESSCPQVALEKNLY